MESPFPSVDPENGPEQPDAPGKPMRLRDIPLRTIFPNLLTLLAICSGLTSIKFAVEDRIELAVAAIIFAGFLDGIDGRVARFLKSTTSFGAQMDSLADFVNFGVAPGILLYFTILQPVGPIGWIVVLIYASCACLRLARFNVSLEDPDRPAWHTKFFTGVPAPAGALIALLPVYLLLLGVEPSAWLAAIVEIYVLFCGFLMVSNLPTFSGKEIAQRLRSDLVFPFMILAVFMVGAVVSYPWIMLSLFAAIYLASLPFSWSNFQRRIAAENTKEE